MNCQTVKKGVECVFMTKKGCEFNGGTCHTIIPQCEGCERAREFEAGVFCITVPDPQIKWRRGTCNLATHIKEKTESKKPMLNPIKASKRGAR
ncbi:MAG: PxxKW family cysteine-rich protein [Deltaproteobacteria bacterium]|nr:PxxKW family cysteine-rich protein [Deltaproteobacteria bacterium]MBW2051540.1 PxxKW family cysteine-rich protein [Deltaproteobacteria bacterium]MBW2140105.1 PxxKW family cysteine-rich protein [Deltaproteobacteria bacterium]MBW2322030.1 PxxKW family cysteine-rich protein [Deltaproteobacteria bacterium]